MNVGTLLQRMENGETLKELAQDMGLNPSTIQRRLKKMGYKYDNSAKLWKWESDGEPPLNFDLTSAQIPKRTHTTNEEHKEVAKVSQKSAVDSTRDGLKIEEIKLLRMMMKDFKKGQEEKKQPQSNDKERFVSPHHRLKDLSESDKVRKNIFLSTSVNDDFEEFCKRERLQKSDVVELALIDFMEKYK